MIDRWLCGWRVASVVDLPQLPAWNGDQRPPDLVIARGPVPEVVPAAVACGPLLQIDPRGACRYEIPGIATFMIEHGSRVTIDASRGASDRELALLLLGSVLALLCLQRGRLPLHAAAVDVNGCALLISGDAAAGKSTIAAWLADRGHGMLSDDVAVAEVLDDRILVWPVAPVARLWRDASRWLHYDISSLEQDRDGLDRYSMPMRGTFSREPKTLRAHARLQPTLESRLCGRRRESGHRAVMTASDTVHMQRAAAQILGRETLMRWTLRLATIPTARISYLQQPGEIGAVADSVASCMAAE